MIPVLSILVVASERVRVEEIRNTVDLPRKPAGNRNAITKEVTLVAVT